VRCPACERELELGASFCTACLTSIEPRSPSPTEATATARPADGAFADTEPLDADASRCPVHSDLLAASTCERCGRFICVRCAPDVLQRGHASCPECLARQAAADTPPGGIGGWLLVPAVYALLMPAASVSALTAIAVMPSLRGMVTHTSVVVVGAWAISTLVLAILFFRKKRMVPPLYVLALALQVVSATLSDGNVPRALAVALVLVPYLLLSRRVRATFVR
jgi:Protein of unknown function (DUF2569)